MATSRCKRYFYGALGIVLLLGGWKLASLVISSEIILPAPEVTILKTLRFFIDPAFYHAVGLTLLRGIAGFAISCGAGVIVGIAAGSRPRFHYLIRPFLSTVKATPVMSVILIALIWFSTGTVPIFSAFLMAFPIITGNMIQGIREVDADLLKMARVFNVPKGRVLAGLTIPSVFPFFLSGASTALGITWKVVIAAEVLAQPLRAVGTGLYDAKVRLETAEVFAWTIIAIAVSAATEAVFHAVLGRLRRGKTEGGPDRKGAEIP
jgi:NitT/TauT family transport system permease protein